MEWNRLFIINSILLGIGLSMDAFSVSLANGLNEPEMKRKKMCAIAGIFALFQAAMPMIGWTCVHMMLHYFQVVQQYIPWIAFLLLLFLGGKMLFEGIRQAQHETDAAAVGLTALLLQGLATSIDALSVGFTIANYGLTMAIVCVAIIAAVTFTICTAGLIIGKKFGTKFAHKATIFGGIILILIGIEILVTDLTH